MPLKGVDNMINVKISGLMGELRMTQKELSEKTGIRPNTINALYHDMAESIKFEQLDRICEVLGCDLHDILEYKPNKIKFSWREKEATEKP